MKQAALMFYSSENCGFLEWASYNIHLQAALELGTCLVHCNDYYIGIEISIIMYTLSWNVISIIIH